MNEDVKKARTANIKDSKKCAALSLKSRLNHTRASAAL